VQVRLHPRSTRRCAHKVRFKSIRADANRTGLAQIVGQVQGSAGYPQPNCWAKSRRPTLCGPLCGTLCGPLCGPLCGTLWNTVWNPP
jgi:hypothetical protein